MSSYELTLPLTAEDATLLRAGDTVRLTGPVFTMRDAGHLRTCKHLEEQGSLPFDLDGQTLFYAGPTPAPEGRPIGSVGPTTASRMDEAAPILYEAGIAATIGKGNRSGQVQDACREHGTIYFATTGGAAALLSSHVASAEPVAWEELGTEALVKLELENFPAFVAFDTCGNSLYEMIKRNTKADA